MQLGVAFVGLVMALVTLLAIDLKLPGGLVEGSGGLIEARTAGFTVLVLAQLFNCFNSRSDRTSAFRGLFTNRWLWAAIALSLLLQVLVVHAPLLNRAFATTPLTLGDWALCARPGQRRAVGRRAQEAAAAPDIAAALSADRAGWPAAGPGCPGATSWSSVDRWPSATAR